MANRARFTIWRSSADSQWYWNLTAKNNKIILASEGYTTQWMAMKGTFSVRKNTLFGKRFHEFQSSENREYYFNLVAKNGEIIGRSEGYTSKGGRANGIASVIYNAPYAGMKLK